MSEYKVGDRVKIIGGIGTPESSMIGRVGTVVRSKIFFEGVKYFVLVDGFDNPRIHDGTCLYSSANLSPWRGDTKEAILAARIRYNNMIANNENRISKLLPKIKNVIYNDPATIVFWEDGTKTVVKCKNEKFDPEKGLAMAFSKKMFGNKGNYYEVFKKWLLKEEKSESADIIKDISSKIAKPKPQTFTFDLKPIDINKKLFEALTGAPSGTTTQFEDAKEEPKRNPVEEAYKKLVDHRDNNGEINFDELIGLLGEALDD